MDALFLQQNLATANDDDFSRIYNELEEKFPDIPTDQEALDMLKAFKEFFQSPERWPKRNSAGHRIAERFYNRLNDPLSDNESMAPFILEACAPALQAGPTAFAAELCYEFVGRMDRAFFRVSENFPKVHQLALSVRLKSIKEAKDEEEAQDTRIANDKVENTFRMRFFYWLEDELAKRLDLHQELLLFSLDSCQHLNSETVEFQRGLLNKFGQASKKSALEVEIGDSA